MIRVLEERGVNRLVYMLKVYTERRFLTQQLRSQVYHLVCYVLSTTTTTTPPSPHLMCYYVLHY